MKKVKFSTSKSVDVVCKEIEQNDNWRVPAIRKAYSKLENVLGQMFKQ